jgi:two-component system, OmpR family, alkaline phosphatase synthesis response regulator PhoP
MTKNILLVEDEEDLRMTLTDRLKGEGYSVATASDGEEGFRKALRARFDLIILDIMLPRRNGFDVCRDVRQAGCMTPILMLTAKNHTMDKVLGLKLGADDYVAKPFKTIELMARIEAILRRASAPKNVGVLHFGKIKIDLLSAVVTRDGVSISLSAREFRLLQFLVEHAGETLSRAEILSHVWGYEGDTFTRTVDVHVGNLRQKLERNPKKPELLLTVTGMGYRWSALPHA